PEDLAAGRPERCLREAIAQGTCTDEGWLLRRDGTRFWASISISAVYDESGQLRGFADVAHDLTERERAEQELARVTAESERQRRLYQTILSSIPDLIYVFDLDHRFTYANEALLAIWGMRWED